MPHNPTHNPPHNLTPNKANANESLVPKASACKCPKECCCCEKKHEHGGPMYYMHLTEQYKQDHPDSYGRMLKSAQPTPVNENFPPPCTDNSTVRYRRKATCDMTPTEWSRFRAAWLSVVNSGFAGSLVEVHRGPYLMHGNNYLGRNRFPPWHRAMTMLLERELHLADPWVILPYWDYERDRTIPAAIANFHPTVNLPDGTSVVVTRSPNPNQLMPIGTEGAVLGETTFNDFALALQNMHNMAHVSVGGSMSSVLHAPADPIFYMLHANVDRLWYRWQLQPGNAGNNMGLLPPQNQLTPWNVNAAQLLDIGAVTFEGISFPGYRYVVRRCSFAPTNVYDVDEAYPNESVHDEVGDFTVERFAKASQQHNGVDDSVLFFKLAKETGDSMPALQGGDLDGEASFATVRDTKRMWYSADETRNVESDVGGATAPREIEATNSIVDSALQRRLDDDAIASTDVLPIVIAVKPPIGEHRFANDRVSADGAFVEGDATAGNPNYAFVNPVQETKNEVLLRALGNSTVQNFAAKASIHVRAQRTDSGEVKDGSTGFFKPGDMQTAMNMTGVITATDNIFNTHDYMALLKANYDRTTTLYDAKIGDVAAASGSATSADDCVDFEDIAASTKYQLSGPASFVSEGRLFHVLEETDAHVALPSTAGSGELEVHAAPSASSTKNAAGDYGQCVEIDNALMAIDLHNDPQHTGCFKYKHYGGHVYLRINGQSYDFTSGSLNPVGTHAPAMSKYHGLQLGGVEVRVIETFLADGNREGTVLLKRDRRMIREVHIGGQELFVDKVCVPWPDGADDDWIDFEDLAAGKKYGAGDTFVSEGGKFVVRDYLAVQLPSSPGSGRVCVLADPGSSVPNLSKATGQCLNVENKVLAYDAGGERTGCFKFADYGGHAYLRINGQSYDFGTSTHHAIGTHASDLVDYDGLILGGVQVRVDAASCVTGTGTVIGNGGTVYLRSATRPIQTVEVGGQEFYVDRYCFPCPTPFDRDNPKDTLTSVSNIVNVVKADLDANVANATSSAYVATALATMDPQGGTPLNAANIKSLYDFRTSFGSTTDPFLLMNVQKGYVQDIIDAASRMERVHGVFLDTGRLDDQTPEKKGVVHDLSNALAIHRSTNIQAAPTEATGDGVKVCVFEGSPSSETDLCIADKYDATPATTSTHCRHVCGMICNTEEGSPDGFAPDSSLYLANDYSLDALTWAVQEKGCTVVNQSFHRRAEAQECTPSFDDIYKDYLALTYPWPFISQAAGNYYEGDDDDVDPIEDEYVNHKGYNSLNAGNHVDDATAMVVGSVFRNPCSTHGDRELPEISANGDAVLSMGMTKTGTSMSSPCVAGVAAQLQSINATVKSWPEAMRAILMAGAERNVRDDYWYSDVLDGTDAHDGAGSLNAFNSARILKNLVRRNNAPTPVAWSCGRLSSDHIAHGMSTFCYRMHVPHDTNFFSTKRHMRVALAWSSTIGGEGESLTSTLDVDLDVLVYDASGALVANSSSWDNSYEIVDFKATKGEDYEIRIRRWSGSSPTYYGIAWTYFGSVFNRLIFRDPSWNRTIVFEPGTAVGGSSTGPIFTLPEGTLVVSGGISAAGTIGGSTLIVPGGEQPGGGGGGATGSATACIDFEDLVAGTAYTAGAAFVSEGGQFDVRDEANPAVNLASATGSVRVNASPGAGVFNVAHHFDQSLNVNNKVLVHHTPSQPLTGCFNYGETGGFVYLKVNGVSYSFSTLSEHPIGEHASDLSDYDGKMIAGVLVTVTRNVPTGDHHGVVRFEAQGGTRITSVEVGGQELHVDHFCFPCDPAIDFPPPPTGGTPGGTVAPGSTPNA